MLLQGAYVENPPLWGSLGLKHPCVVGFFFEFWEITSFFFLFLVFLCFLFFFSKFGVFAPLRMVDYGRLWSIWSMVDGGLWSIMVDYGRYGRWIQGKGQNSKKMKKMKNKAKKRQKKKKNWNCWLGCPSYEKNAPRHSTDTPEVPVWLFFFTNREIKWRLGKLCTKLDICDSNQRRWGQMGLWWTPGHLSCSWQIIIRIKMARFKAMWSLQTWFLSCWTPLHGGLLTCVFSVPFQGFCKVGPVCGVQVHCLLKESTWL